MWVCHTYLRSLRFYRHTLRLFELLIFSKEFFRIDFLRAVRVITGSYVPLNETLFVSERFYFCASVNICELAKVFLSVRGLLSEWAGCAIFWILFLIYCPIFTDEFLDCTKVFLLALAGMFYLFCRGSEWLFFLEEVYCLELIVTFIKYTLIYIKWIIELPQMYHIVNAKISATKIMKDHLWTIDKEESMKVVLLPFTFFFFLATYK